MFLFGGNVAVEDLDDAGEIVNQCPDLRRFSQRTLVSNPTVFHFRALFAFAAMSVAAASLLTLIANGGSSGRRPYFRSWHPGEVPISHPGRWITSALSCRLAQRISDRRGFR